VGQCRLYSTHEGELGSCGGGTHLLNRARQEKAERLWILAAFPTLKEARTHETLCSLRYQIPTTTYEPHGEYGDYQNIDAIFSEFGDRENGCLSAHGRLFEYPLWKAGENGTSKCIGINAWTRHYSCNLLPKLMNLNTAEETEAVIDRVSVDQYCGKVYSLDVEKDHTYLADGLTTCNSIYGFRGAHTGSMDELERRFQCRTLPLSVSYRCPQAVVLKAREWVAHIEWAEGAQDGYVGELGTDWRGQSSVSTAPVVGERCVKCQCEYTEHRKELCLDCPCGCRCEYAGSVSKWKELKDFSPGDAILCRLTRPLVAVAFELVRNRIACRVLGRDIGAGLVALVRRVCKVARIREETGLGAFCEALAEYSAAQKLKLIQKKKWAEAGRLDDQIQTVLVFMDSREVRGDGNTGLTSGSDTRRGVVAEATVADLIAEIEALFEDNGGTRRGVTLSTIHKFKGLEADRVFVLSGESCEWRWARQDWEHVQEGNLRYVACTRAKRELRYVTLRDLGLEDD